MSEFKVLNIVGLSLGIIGVFIIFIWGPPQPSFEANVGIDLEDETIIDEKGTTVSKYGEKQKKQKRKFEVRSRIGLIFIGLGFLFQLWASLL